MTTFTFPNGDTAETPNPKYFAAWRLVYPNGRISAGNGCGAKVAFSGTATNALKAGGALRGFEKRGQKANGGAPIIEVATAN